MKTLRRSIAIILFIFSAIGIKVFLFGTTDFGFYQWNPSRLIMSVIFSGIGIRLFHWDKKSDKDSIGKNKKRKKTQEQISSLKGNTSLLYIFSGIILGGLITYIGLSFFIYTKSTADIQADITSFENEIAKTINIEYLPYNVINLDHITTLLDAYGDNTISDKETQEIEKLPYEYVQITKGTYTKEDVDKKVFSEDFLKLSTDTKKKSVLNFRAYLKEYNKYMAHLSQLSIFNSLYSYSFYRDNTKDHLDNIVDMEYNKYLSTKIAILLNETMYRIDKSTKDVLGNILKKTHPDRAEYYEEKIKYQPVE